MTSIPRQKIRVDSLKTVSGKGALRGFATVTIADKLTIHSIRIVQQDGQAAWVALPQTEVKAADGGKPRYFPVIEILDDDLKKQISEAVLTEFNASR